MRQPVCQSDSDCDEDDLFFVIQFDAGSHVSKAVSDDDEHEVQP